MNVIKTALTESIVKNYAICEKILRHCNESIESKAERLISTTTRLLNVI